MKEQSIKSEWDHHVWVQEMVVRDGSSRPTNATDLNSSTAIQPDSPLSTPTTTGATIDATINAESGALSEASHTNDV